MNTIEQLQGISKALDTANEAMVTNENLIKQIVTMERRLVRQEKQLFELFEAYKKEQKDVERLKSLSLQNFFHTLKNDKDDVLEKEEREALEAKVRADRLKYEIEADKSKLDLYKARKVDPSVLDKQVKKLLEEKYDLMKTFKPQHCDQIKGLNEEALKLHMNLKEVDEAIEAGGEVMKRVEAVSNSLKSAENWGTYDMLGGGLMSTMIKRDHMQTAVDLSNDLSLSMKRFSDELEDISESFEATLNLDGFLGTADYFFDGLLVDMSVQEKIHDAQNQIIALDNRVIQLMNNLKRDKADVQREMTNIKEQIKETIVNA